MDVHVPDGIDPMRLDRLNADGKARAAALRREGKWVHLCRITGAYANFSVVDVAHHDELQVALPTLPLLPFMHITVLALARHPSAIG